ncbi:unnamed protein product [Caenorhabditis bovis]|uniref:RRM domain-containing protein n=1 Tax=Caenorhabditis bovis TaxID=2654633 RepID=A0A8S1EQ08_9PELO|nr:unnamed protein product [Caenorhabditis bovis]
MTTLVDSEKTCYVSSFSDKVSDDLLEELFTQVGPVTRVIMKTLKDSDKRYAMVEFEDEESVLFAVETLDGILLYNMCLNVKPSRGTNKEKEYAQIRPMIEKRQRVNQASSTHSTPSRAYERERERDRDSWKDDITAGRPAASATAAQHPGHRVSEFALLSEHRAVVVVPSIDAVNLARPSSSSSHHRSQPYGVPSYRNRNQNHGFTTPSQPAPHYMRQNSAPSYRYEQTPRRNDYRNHGSFSNRR